MVLCPVEEIPGGILKGKAKLIVNEKENILLYKHESYAALNKMLASKLLPHSMINKIG